MNRAPLGSRGLYDCVAAAEYLSCSVDVVERLIREGHLAAFRPAGMKRGRRITHAELERYCSTPADATGADVIDIGRTA